MSFALAKNAKAIAAAIPTAEADVDTAMLSLSNLMSALVQARSETRVPAATGQATLMRLAKAQVSLLNISNDVLRTHREMEKIGREIGLGDAHECPKPTATVSATYTLKAVA